MPDTNSTTETKVCKRCGRPVVVNVKHFDLFEQMHWVCFHLEYEHGDHDPDEPCGVPGCFWSRTREE